MKKFVFTSFLLPASNKVILMQAIPKQIRDIVAFGKKIASPEFLCEIPRNDKIELCRIRNTKKEENGEFGYK